jgi:hypothetical protein
MNVKDVEKYNIKILIVPTNFRSYQTHVTVSTHTFQSSQDWILLVMGTTYS